MSTSNRAPHQIAPPPSFESIRQSLIDNGVAFIPGYLDAARAAALREDVRKLAYREHEQQLKDGESRLGRFALDEVAGLGCSSALTEITGDPFLRRIREDFFAPYAPDLHKVYCHHDVKRMSYNTSWHFDRGLSLKYFFYLNDVTTANGAFCYDLGSHRANAVKQHLWWQAKMPILNYVPDREVVAPQAMEGPAGSLIIFDTSGFHRAGEIRDGTERWVIRFHVRAGKRADGADQARNPYARRNWDYRSACWSERKEEQAAPWQPKATTPRVRDEDEEGVRAGSLRTRLKRIYRALR
jgi:hypothetical protein